MNIVEIGLVDGVEIDKATGYMQVTMTLTAPGSPLAGDIITV